MSRKRKNIFVKAINQRIGAQKRKISRKTGIPFTKQGRNRKAQRMWWDLFFWWLK